MQLSKMQLKSDKISIPHMSPLDNLRLHLGSMITKRKLVMAKPSKKTSVVKKTNPIPITPKDSMVPKTSITSMFK